VSGPLSESDDERGSLGSWWSDGKRVGGQASSRQTRFQPGHHLIVHATVM
jgi:hypothetical protein